MYLRYWRQDLPLGPSDMFFPDYMLLRYRPIWEEGACIFRSARGRRGNGRINGGTRMLERAAESKEEALGYGARSTSITLPTLSRPKGGSTTPAARRIVATGGAARCGGGGHAHDQPPPENPVRKVRVISAPPRPF
jgi:hypothetical protein